MGLKFAFFLVLFSTFLTAKPAKLTEFAITANLACGIFDDTAVKCSRKNHTTLQSTTSELHVPSGEIPIQISAVRAPYGPYRNTDQACVLTASGNVYCWYQDLCNGGQGAPSSPLNLPIGKLPPIQVPLPGKAKKIASYDLTRNMALLEDGLVYLWKNEIKSNQFAGTGCLYEAPRILSERVKEVTITSLELPDDLSIGGTDFFLHKEHYSEWRSVAFGAQHRCAIRNHPGFRSGWVYCDGNNKFGQSHERLRRKDEAQWERVSTPTWMVALRGKFVQVVAANAASWAGGNVDYSCALSSDGNVYCWGGNFEALKSDPLYHGTWGIPVKVDLGQAATSIVTNRYGKTCAILEDGSTACWGPWAATKFKVTNSLGIGW